MLLSFSCQRVTRTSDSNENKNEKYTQRKREIKAKQERKARGKENFDDESEYPYCMAGIMYKRAKAATTPFTSIQTYMRFQNGIAFVLSK